MGDYTSMVYGDRHPISGVWAPNTIEYYRAIIDAHRKRQGDGSYPALIIDSIDVTAVLNLVADNKLAELAAWLGSEIERLYRAGAEIAILAEHLLAALHNRAAQVLSTTSASDAARHLRGDQ